jgi:hypothetical protein
VVYTCIKPTLTTVTLDLATAELAVERDSLLRVARFIERLKRRGREYTDAQRRSHSVLLATITHHLGSPVAHTHTPHGRGHTHSGLGHGSSAKKRIPSNRDKDLSDTCDTPISARTTPSARGARKSL